VVSTEFRCYVSFVSMVHGVVNFKHPASTFTRCVEFPSPLTTNLLHFSWYLMYGVDLHGHYNRGVLHDYSTMWE
jgi:hypothetical protein